MLYREVGQYKTSYAADQAMFPILQDKIGILVILFIAFVVIPLTMSSFTISSVMIPVLIFSLAAIGLNLLTGYTGLISLGTGGFMGVGAYACYKLTTLFPDANIILPDPVLRILLGGDRRAVRFALVAHQGLLSRGRDFGRAVFPVLVFRAAALARQLQRLQCHRSADPQGVRHRGDRPERDADRALSGRAHHRRYRPPARPAFGAPPIC